MPVYQYNSEFIIQKYFCCQNRCNFLILFIKEPFQPYLPIFFGKSHKTFEIIKLPDFTNAGSYLDLVNFFERKGYTKEFAELVVLKGLNDGYYTGQFF